MYLPIYRPIYLSTLMTRCCKCETPKQQKNGAADTQRLWARAEEKPNPETAGQPNAGTLGGVKVTQNLWSPWEIGCDEATDP